MDQQLQNWKLPKTSASQIYKSKLFKFSSDYIVKIIEEYVPLQEGYENFTVLSRKLIESHRQKYKYLHLRIIQVGLKPLTKLGVRDRRHNQFEDSLLGIVESSLCDEPIYFKCFPNFTVSLTDPNILQSLVLNIKIEGFDMLKGMRNVPFVYRLCYKVMNTVVPNIRSNPEFMQDRKGEITLFITDLEKSNVLVLKTISWNQVKLPEVWTLEKATPLIKEPPRQVDSIIQYLNGDVEIKFSQNRKERLNMGDLSKPNSARSSTSSIPLSEIEKERQRVEILRVNKTPDQINQSEYKVEIPETSYRQRRDNSPIPSDMGYNIATITEELQKWYLKNYIAYCKKIGEIIDFFQWIEEAYYELQKDFPNFSNASCLAIIESTYQTYIIAKGKPIPTIHHPYTSLIMKTEERVIDAIPFKFGITNDSINHVIHQNSYTNMCSCEKGESSSKEDSIPFKPPLSFEKDKFHLNSKKDSEFIEELIVRFQKIKVEKEKSKVTITTLKGENSEQETPNEEEILKPTPVNLQFEEKAEFAQFNGESVVEWNIDGMSEYHTRTIIKYMLMYASAAKLKGNTDEAIAKAIVTDFTEQLQGWWDFYLTENTEERILAALCIDPITHEQKADAVNTLIYTIMAHFVGANELHSDRTTEQLINLRCPTLSYFYWYKAPIFSKILTKKDCNEDFWKEKFLSGLPKSFAKKMRNKLKAKYNNIIPY
ncbi:hypothetical protein CDL12_24212 [Handroanthus impetiginosus]|uniref:Uncharacterized protein n=1 Tax=Handroanthus impetiginosus TaxID=429701 RepID=A0A2G9GDI9_9LAMI|nr:hypothetical protein CDL12_24212 [Handroanthus impetiginosus]